MPNPVTHVHLEPLLQANVKPQCTIHITAQRSVIAITSPTATSKLELLIQDNAKQQCAIHVTAPRSVIAVTVAELEPL